jgi:hypothetical protein
MGQILFLVALQLQLVAVEVLLEAVTLQPLQPLAVQAAAADLHQVVKLGVLEHLDRDLLGVILLVQQEILVRAEAVELLQ